MQVALVDHLLEDYSQVIEGKVQSLSNLKNDMIVITGGTGFVGSWLTGLLAYLNDNYSFNTRILIIARYVEKFKIARPDLANRKDVDIIAADIRYLHELPTETNWLIHAAGTPDNRIHASNPLETMSVISNGTQAVLKAVSRCSNFKMLLNLSSGLIYGQQPWDFSNITEQFAGVLNCGTVSSAYAEAKRFAETLCHSARSQSRLPIITARPFAFMGPCQSLETPWALNNFIKDALNGNAIKVLGDGKTIRSYMYASDMAFWFLSILCRGQSSEIYNVGSPSGISLEELALQVKKHTNDSLEIKLKTSGVNESQNSRFVPDISFAKERLQLEQTVDLETALKKTISWNKKKIC